MAEATTFGGKLFLSISTVITWEDGGGTTGGDHSPIFTNDKSVLKVNADISTSCLVLFALPQTSSHPPLPAKGREECNLTDLCLPGSSGLCCSEQVGYTGFGGGWGQRITRGAV